jgi:hypothetical protein
MRTRLLHRKSGPPLPGRAHVWRMKRIRTRIRPQRDWVDYLGLLALWISAVAPFMIFYLSSH